MKYFLWLFIAIGTQAQQLKNVDFQSVKANLDLDVATKKVLGQVAFQFEVLNEIDTIKIDAVNMKVDDVRLNNKKVKYLVTNKQILLFDNIKRATNYLTFKYEVQPKQTMYFVGNNDDLQIWTQGQGKNSSAWFPSFDDLNEKLIFNLTIGFDKKFEVISNGLLKKTFFKKNKKYWTYEMQKPMSSYLLMLAIGQFEHQKINTSSGIPLSLYYQPKDRSKYEATYRYSKEIFDFFEKEIGVPYPWSVYKQIPVKDFLYAGMENTTATIFSQDFVIDAIGFHDKSYVNVNAHELAHHWFGDLITSKSDVDHWLHEGFATYYALLAEAHLYGQNEMDWELYNMAEQLQKASETDSIPILSNKASSLTYYKKGAWALHALKHLIGPEAFRKGIKNYLQKYQFLNVNTNEFLDEMNKVAPFDQVVFKKKWLENGKFDIIEAMKILNQSPFMNQYFDVASMENVSYLDKKSTFLELMKSNAFYPIKSEILFQIKDIPYESKSDIIQAAFATQNLSIKQDIARLGIHSEDFKPLYTQLLNDNSYITKEIVLTNLWRKFPEDQTALLNQTQEWIGFNDKNLRILWLTLALKTSNYNPQIKTSYYDELIEYSSEKYESATRQNALNNLIFLNKNDFNYLPHLVQALTSHKWQFSKFAREKIRLMLKNSSHRSYFETLLVTLPNDQKTILNHLLLEK